MSRHEETDVNVNRVFAVAAGLAALTAAACLVVWLVFIYFDRRESASAAFAPPLAEGQGLRQPPALISARFEHRKTRCSIAISGLTKAREPCASPSARR